MQKSSQQPMQKTRMNFLQGDRREARQDWVATEEPLEIQVVEQEDGLLIPHNIAVTMRTPGEDFDLALGFLFTEQVLTSARSVAKIDYPRDDSGEPNCNRVQITLAEGVSLDLNRLSRHLFTSSSCGLCGKMTIDSIRAGGLAAVNSKANLKACELFRLPKKLRAAQTTFGLTGGLHASGLFSLAGNLLQASEDVGRHNALDKVLGAILRREAIPASESVLILSGRISFELVQKALMAGIPIVAGVGAPSSLAIDLAREFEMTLVGFLKKDRFNIYTGSARIG